MGIQQTLLNERIIVLLSVNKSEVETANYCFCRHKDLVGLESWQVSDGMMELLFLHVSFRSVRSVHTAPLGDKQIKYFYICG